MTAKKMFAEVAPAIPIKPGKSPAFYTYAVPRRDEKNIHIGSIVQVPLGPRRVAGAVLRLHRRPVPYPTKPLTLTSRPPLTTQQMTLAAWISTTMHSGLGYTLRLFYSPLSSKKTRATTKPARENTVVNKNRQTQLALEKSDRERYGVIKKYLPEAATTQSLIIVPELAMIPPLQKFLSTYFPAVHPYHSEQTSKQLGDVWQVVYEGQPVIVIGTQKVLFLPWQDLSHLVLEEEYVDTHKLWDQYPRLDNRYGVRQLAVIHNSELLISSSAESAAIAHGRRTGRLKELTTNPIVQKTKVVPLSFDDRRQGHLLPPEVLGQMKNAVRRGERTIILHNQRGTWRTAVCNKCHQALRCPNCESTVFVEGSKTKQRVQCRQCLYTGILPDRCPTCQTKNLRTFGPGAAKIAATLQALLPSSSIIAVSADKKDVDSRWKSADIVLGTTALWRYATEGSFDHALWLFPESTLLYPDYRSSERAYLMLARLQKTIPARRRVTIVTRYADLVSSSLAAPPEKIIAQVLLERKRLHYPPFTDLVKLTCLARTEVKSLDRARTIREKIDAILPAGVIVRGPYQGFNKKEAGAFATHILLAGPLDHIVPLYKDLPVDRAELSPAQIL